MKHICSLLATRPPVCSLLHLLSQSGLSHRPHGGCQHRGRPRGLRRQRLRPAVRLPRSAQLLLEEAYLVSHRGYSWRVVATLVGEWKREMNHWTFFLNKDTIPSFYKCTQGVPLSCFSGRRVIPHPALCLLRLNMF